MQQYLRILRAQVLATALPSIWRAGQSGHGENVLLASPADDVVEIGRDLERPRQEASPQEWAGSFLAERDPSHWSAPTGLPKGLNLSGLFAQKARSGLEVALVTAAAQPSTPEMRRVHKARRSGRASPVLIAALYPGAEDTRVSLCGPAGDAPPVWHDLDPARVERITGLALDEPTHHASARFLASALPDMRSPLPGIRNVGLLATHELSAGVPQRSDWDEAVRRSLPVLAAQGLVRRLGFGVQPSSTSASLLTVNGSGDAAGLGRITVSGEPYRRMNLWSIADHFDDSRLQLPQMNNPNTGKPLAQGSLFWRPSRQ